MRNSHTGIRYTLTVPRFIYEQLKTISTAFEAPMSSMINEALTVTVHKYIDRAERILKEQAEKQTIDHQSL